MKKIITIFVVLTLSLPSLATVTVYNSFDAGMGPDSVTPAGAVAFWGTGGGPTSSIDTVTKKFGAGSLQTATTWHMYTDGGGGFQNAVSQSAGTMEMWVAPNWNSGSGQSQVIALLGANFDYPYSFIPGIHLTYIGGDWMTAWYKGASGGSVELQTNVSWTAGSWHHLAVTWDPTTVAFYMDGSLVSSAANPSVGDFLGLDNLYLGGPASDVRTWDGWIDDFAISDNVKYSGATYDVPTGPVPEPATVCLLGLGGLILLKRRRA